MKIFKRPKNREDGSDLDENLTESIAAMNSSISESFPRHSGSKNMISKNFPRQFRKFFRDGVGGMAEPLNPPQPPKAEAGRVR